MQKSHSKELFSHTFTYGIGLFVNRFLSFLLIPLYTYFFKPGELGVFNILQSVWLVIAIFYLFGIETAFIKYFTDEKIPEQNLPTTIKARFDFAMGEMQGSNVQPMMRRATDQ